MRIADIVNEYCSHRAHVTHALVQGRLGLLLASRHVAHDVLKDASAWPLVTEAVESLTAVTTTLYGLSCRTLSEKTLPAIHSEVDGVRRAALAFMAGEDHAYPLVCANLRRLIEELQSLRQAIEAPDVSFSREAVMAYLAGRDAQWCRCRAIEFLRDRLLPSAESLSSAWNQVSYAAYWQGSENLRFTVRVGRVAAAVDGLRPDDDRFGASMAEGLRITDSLVSCWSPRVKDVDGALAKLLHNEGACSVTDLLVRVRTIA